MSTVHALTCAALTAFAVTGCSSKSSGGSEADASDDVVFYSSSSGGASSGASGSSGGEGGSSSSGGFVPPTWFLTCGVPVCGAPSAEAGGLTDDAGAPCPPLGSSCQLVGQHCGTSDPSINCGATEVCAMDDPKLTVGCPK